jgi:hypothetical protein
MSGISWCYILHLFSMPTLKIKATRLVPAQYCAASTNINSRASCSSEFIFMSMWVFSIPVPMLSNFAPLSSSCSIYQNPAILKAATAAFWTSCRVVSKFLWIVRSVGSCAHCMYDLPVPLFEERHCCQTLWCTVILPRSFAGPSPAGS